MKTSPLKGFGAPKAKDKWAVGIYSREFAGKTRFIATAAQVAKTAVIALDRKSKRTLENVCNELGILVGVDLLVNEQEYFNPRESLRMAGLDCMDKANLKLVREFYKPAWDKIKADCEALADSDVEVVAIDKFNELEAINLYWQFGRMNMVPQLKRWDIGQDIVELLKLLQDKHVILVMEHKEIYRDTGKKDNNGETIREGTGKFTWRGPKNLGYNVNTILEFTKDDKKPFPERYGVNIVECQANPSMVGEKNVLEGELVTWQNLKDICFPE